MVYREGLGFGADRDPTSPGGLSNKQRKALFDELRTACGAYICGKLATALAPLLHERCRILADEALLTAVREHNLIAFRQAWKKFDEAVPGSVRVVPQDALRAAIEKDYEAMQGMMLGDAPEFDWVMKQLQAAEDTINRR